MKKEHMNLHGKALEHQCFVWDEFVNVVDSISPNYSITLTHKAVLLVNLNYRTGKNPNYRRYRPFSRGNIGDFR